MPLFASSAAMTALVPPSTDTPDQPLLLGPRPEVGGHVAAGHQECGVAGHVVRGFGRDGLDPHPRLLCGRRQATPLLAYGGLRRPVVEHDEGGTSRFRAVVGEGVGEDVTRPGGTDERQQVLGVRCDGAPAGRASERLGNAAGCSCREHGATPQQRSFVGKRDREHLGRVDRQVPVGRAGHSDVVECRGDRFGVGLGAEPDPRQEVQHDHCSGQLVAALRRQHDRVTAFGMLRDKRSGRAGGHDLAPSPDRLRHCGGRIGVGANGRQHENEIERSRPSRADSGRARRRTAPDTRVRAPPAGGVSPDRPRRSPGGRHPPARPRRPWQWPPPPRGPRGAPVRRSLQGTGARRRSARAPPDRRAGTRRSSQPWPGATPSGPRGRGGRGTRP